ncbi:MAG: hypothetical protein K8U03_06090 [Planctomycetia bacterium]|nr:hypothetical protein [Planctomycetia bacterium]
MAAKKPFNPFYLLLVIAGTAFCISACAYGVLAMRSLRPDRQVTSARTVVEPPHPLMSFLERDGEKLLLGELAFLALFSFAAMATDGYWTRRAVAADARLKATTTEKQS